jgi:hypothetical protein
MGTDINGVFGHQAAFPPQQSLADSMSAGIEKASLLIHNRWRLDTAYDTEPLRLVRDPEGLSVWFGPRTAIVSTGFGWDQASEDSELRRMVTSAITAIARFFHSPAAIFLPDDVEPWSNVSDWVGEGIALDQLQQKLASIKEPSVDFSAAIRQVPDFIVDGYIVEQLNNETG